MKEVIIRQAELKDSQKIAEIYVSSWKHAYKDLMTDSMRSSMSVQKEKKIWDKYLEDDNSHVLVAEKDESVVGFIMFGETGDADLEDSKSKSLEIYSIYIKPEKFRSGIGTRLLSALENLGKGKEIYAWVLEENPIGRSFFEKHGFKKQKQTVKDFKFKGKVFPVVRYKK
jgi:ribosomal protein S18 acetylase RimI-like enzyme